jgi:hypothetical protein
MRGRCGRAGVAGRLRPALGRADGRPGEHGIGAVRVGRQGLDASAGDGRAERGSVRHERPDAWARWVPLTGGRGGAGAGVGSRVHRAACSTRGAFGSCRTARAERGARCNTTTSGAKARPQAAHMAKRPRGSENTWRALDGGLDRQSAPNHALTPPGRPQKALARRAGPLFGANTRFPNTPHPSPLGRRLPFLLAVAQHRLSLARSWSSLHRGLRRRLSRPPATLHSCLYRRPLHRLHRPRHRPVLDEWHRRSIRDSPASSSEMGNVSGRPVVFTDEGMIGPGAWWRAGLTADSEPESFPPPASGRQGCVWKGPHRRAKGHRPDVRVEIHSER